MARQRPGQDAGMNLSLGECAQPSRLSVAEAPQPQIW